MFQIGFSVKVFSFDICYAFRQRTAYHNHVTWEELILSNLYYAADLHVQATSVLECSLASRTAKNLLLIFLIILFAPFIVFVCILDHGHCNDTAHGHESCRRTIEIL